MLKTLGWTELNSERRVKESLVTAQNVILRGKAQRIRGRGRWRGAGRPQCWSFAVLKLRSLKSHACLEPLSSHLWKERSWLHSVSTAVTLSPRALQTCFCTGDAWGTLPSSSSVLLWDVPQIFIWLKNSTADFPSSPAVKTPPCNKGVCSKPWWRN